MLPRCPRRRAPTRAVLWSFTKLALLCLGAWLGTARGGAAQVLISQVSPSGGMYASAFVELYNPTNAPIDLSAAPGWSLHVSNPMAGSAWSKLALTGTIPAHGYYLTQPLHATLDVGMGLALPATDKYLGFLGVTLGKVALVDHAAATLSTACPPVVSGGGTIVDFVGLGTISSCREPLIGGTTANNAALFGRHAIHRRLCGAGDGNDNAADWFVGLPTPRNSTVAPSQGLTAFASSSPALVQVGESVRLTVAVRDCAGGVVLGATVGVDMTALGGSPTQAFLDDGTNGDEVAGDGLHSFLAIAGGSPLPNGNKHLPVTLTAGAQSGGALLSVSLLASTIPGNSCADAVAIAPVGAPGTPGSYGASTAALTADFSAHGEAHNYVQNAFDTDASMIPATLVARSGRWYSVVGTGTRMSADLCESTAICDSVISVMGGTCDGLSVVAGADDECSGNRPRASWCSVAGATYYVWVAGKLAAPCGGQFTLRISDDGVPCASAVPVGLCTPACPVGALLEDETAGGPSTNDGCDATSVTPSGAQAFTTLTLATGVTTSVCGTSRAYIDTVDPDWYRFQAPANGQLTALLTAQFPAALQLRALSSSGNCTVNTLVSVPGSASRCAPAFVSAFVSAGAWYALRVAPSVTTGFFVGATSTKYTLELTVGGTPAHDACSSAISIAGSGTGPSGVSASNASAVVNGPTTGCSVLVDKDLWYAFEPDFSTAWRFSTCLSTAMDTVIEVFDGCGGSLVACNDNTTGCFGGTGATVVAQLSSQTSYRIRVSSKGNPGPGGLMTLVVEQAQPLNDACAGALALAVPSETVLHMQLATAESPLPPTCSGPFATGSSGVVNYSPGVWYTLVSPLTQTITIDTLTPPQVDTRLWVFTGSCGALACVIANDGLATTNASKVSFVATAGTTYRVLVGTNFISSAVVLSVRGDPTPVNDACTAPSAITGLTGTIAGTTAGATASAMTDVAALPFCSVSGTTSAGFFDVWYAYTAPCSGTVRFGACGSYTFVSVHNACPSSVASNQINTSCGTCGTSSESTAILTAGTTYLVRVAGRLGALPGGPFTLNWSLVDTVPPVITSCGPNSTLQAGASCTTVLPDLTGDVLILPELCGPAVVTQSPVPGTVLAPGPTTVTFTVTDPANLVATCQRTITVVDQTAPTITCPGAQSITSTTVCSPLPSYVSLATTSDNCSAVTVTQSPVAGTLITSGVTTVVLTATDASANASTCSFQVTVTGPPPPSTVYVDDDWAGFALGQDPPGPASEFGCDAFARIQPALDRVGVGGVVSVAAGTYVEELEIAKTLELRGPNVGVSGCSLARVPEAVVIPSVSLPGTQSLVTVAAPLVVIDGMALDGDNPALNSPTTTFGANIDMDIGIHAVPGSSNDGMVVRNNLVRNMYWDGVALGGAGRAGRVERNRIDNVPANSGVEAYADHYAAIEDNCISRAYRGVRAGTFSQPKPVGATASVVNNVITSETISGVGVSTHTDVGGIILVDHGLAASSWTVSGNVLSNTIQNSTGSHGIEVYDVRDAVAMNIASNSVTGFQHGYSLWNCRTSSTITIQGGTVSGGVAAVHASNRNTYFADTQFSCSYAVNGVTCTGTTGSGVLVEDHPSNPTSATVTVRVEGDSVISGWTNGVLVDGADARATIRDNTTGISGNQRSVWVASGRALLENNRLVGSPGAGIRASLGALVDAGDPLGTNVTGLGTGSGPNGASAGGNVLTGYGFDNLAPWAIEDLNTSAQPDVLAFANSYGAVSGDNIENVAFDDTDDAARSRVFASQSGGFLITCPPTLVIVPPTAVGSLPAGATTLAAFMALGGSSSATPVTISSVDSSPSGTPPCPYSLTRTYTLTDPHGNVQVCTQQIEVGQIDSDNDGVANCLDGCPNDPLKTAPGLCGCGVADTDSDRDATPDCNDGCPSDPLKIAAGQCGCGVLDTDTDLDGTADCNDLCPNDPLKIAPGQCGCGQAETDTDGDGTADCNDGCPNDPLKTAPGVCGCGVADTDSDGDGTPNCNDGCPNDPLKTAPGLCGCGTADTDTDSDGIPDCLDNCDTVANPTQSDCDNDAIGDACAIAGGAPDCNANGVPDACDLTAHTSLDVNVNAVPDECEPDPSTAFCFGDGTGTPCPCGNAGAAGRGCANSGVGNLGARLRAFGVASLSADTVQLTGSDMTGPGLFFQGSGQFGAGNGIAFGDGLLCAGGAITRMGVVFPALGQATYPGGLTPAPVHVAGLIGAPGTFHYQCWYRDAVPFCSPATYNLTQGISLVWGP